MVHDYAVGGQVVKMREIVHDREGMNEWLKMLILPILWPIKSGHVTPEWVPTYWSSQLLHVRWFLSHNFLQAQMFILKSCTAP